jgi:hypothetical protein
MNQMPHGMNLIVGDGHDAHQRQSHVRSDREGHREGERERVGVERRGGEVVRC